MLIPYTELEPTTLDALLDDYVTREGTDNGHFTSLEDRKVKLMKLLEKEEAFITYNHQHEQPCLISRSEVPANAWKAYREAKLASEQEEKVSAPCAEDTPKPIIEIPTQPFALGRTLMTREVKAYLLANRFSLENLQDLLFKHSNYNFGDVSEDSVRANLEAITQSEQVLSSFTLDGLKLFVETERGHGQTMVMLAHER